jgi:hypothetical protein
MKSTQPLSKTISMMAMLLAALPSLPLSADHDAGHGQTAQFIFDGTELTKEISLGATESHTLYETREVPSTCYTEELVGYRDECTTVYEPSCTQEWVCGGRGFLNEEPINDRQIVGGDDDHDRRGRGGDRGGDRGGRGGDRGGDHGGHGGGGNHGGGGHGGGGNHGGGGHGGGGHGGPSCGYQTRCIDIPRQSCRQVPEYRTVSYECTKTETVPVGTEVDYQVHAHVNLSFQGLPANIKPSETLKVSLNDSRISIQTLSASGKLLLFAQGTQNQQIVKEDEGPQSPGQKLVSADYTIALIDAQAVLGAVNGGIGDIRIKDQSLIFTVGKVVLPDFLKIDMAFEKSNTGINDKLFKGEVPSQAVSIRDLGSKSEVTIALDRLSMKKQIERGKKYKVMNMILGVRTGAGPGTLLNPETVGSGGSTLAEIKLKAE